VERTSLARKGAKRRGETQRAGIARAAAGSTSLKDGVMSTLEQLEGRQLFAAFEADRTKERRKETSK